MRCCLLGTAKVGRVLRIFDVQQVRFIAVLSFYSAYHPGLRIMPSGAENDVRRFFVALVKSTCSSREIYGTPNDGACKSIRREARASHTVSTPKSPPKPSHWKPLHDGVSVRQHPVCLTPVRSGLSSFRLSWTSLVCWKRRGISFYRRRTRWLTAWEIWRHARGPSRSGRDRPRIEV